MPANSEIRLKHCTLHEGLPVTVTIHELRLGECRDRDIQRMIEEAQSRNENTPNLSEILRAARSKTRTVFVATTPGGEHVGFGMVRLGHGEDADLCGAVVRRDWREKGLLSKLIEANIIWAARKDHRIASAHVLPPSENAVRKFKMNGRRFVESPREKEDIVWFGPTGKKFVIDLRGITL